MWRYTSPSQNFCNWSIAFETTIFHKKYEIMKGPAFLTFPIFPLITSKEAFFQLKEMIIWHQFCHTLISLSNHNSPQCRKCRMHSTVYTIISKSFKIQLLLIIRLRISFGCITTLNSSLCNSISFDRPITT